MQVQREWARERGVGQRERELRASARRLRLEAVAALAVLRVHHTYRTRGRDISYNTRMRTQVEWSISSARRSDPQSILRRASDSNSRVSRTRVPEVRDGARFEAEAERVRVRHGGRREAALRDQRVEQVRDEHGARSAQQRRRPERVARQRGRETRDGRVCVRQQLLPQLAPEAPLVHFCQTRFRASYSTTQTYETVK